MLPEVFFAVGEGDAEDWGVEEMRCFRCGVPAVPATGPGEDSFFLEGVPVGVALLVFALALLSLEVIPLRPLT